MQNVIALIHPTCFVPSISSQLTLFHPYPLQYPPPPPQHTHTLILLIAVMPASLMQLHFTSCWTMSGSCHYWNLNTFELLSCVIKRYYLHFVFHILFIYCLFVIPWYMIITHNALPSGCKLVLIYGQGILHDFNGTVIICRGY